MEVVFGDVEKANNLTKRPPPLLVFNTELSRNVTKYEIFMHTKQGTKNKQHLIQFYGKTSKTNSI